MKFVESNVPDSIRVQVRRFVNGDKYVTHCDLVDKTTNFIVCSGESRCHPNDSPNRKIGRRIAVGRAVKKFFGECRELDVN